MVLTGVIEFADRKMGELSPGVQQRVWLALALAQNPRLLLLDEPVAGLDVVSTRDFYESIRAINENGTAIIMVSHDIASSLSVAKHVLNIGNHTALFFGTAQDYKASNL